MKILYLTLNLNAIYEMYNRITVDIIRYAVYGLEEIL